MQMNVEIYFTKSLILKRFTPKEFNYLFENYSSEEIKQQLGYDSEDEFEKEKKKYELGYSSYAGSIVFFQLIEKESQQIIGGCGFHHWKAEHRRAELGYALKKDTFKRKGYMSETLEFVINYGFNILNLHRIEAMVGTNNIPSLRLMENFNFKEEGCLRQHYFTNNNFEDSLVFSKLVTD